MRKLIILGSVLIVAIAFVGCGDDDAANGTSGTGGTGGTGNAPEYYINYTLGGTNYQLTHGLTNFGDVPVASYGYPGPPPGPESPMIPEPVESEPLVFVAGPVPITNEDFPIDTGLVVELNIPAAAPFTNRSAWINIFNEGTPYLSESGIPSVTVTNFGAVGEAVSGSFSGVLTNYSAGGPAMTVTGHFRVKRIPDGSISIPK